MFSLRRIILTFFFVLCAGLAHTAPYAAFVMDARTGEVLHSRNADTKLYPASLTKMMTLYVVFQAIQKGEINLETKVKISKNAAYEEPSKLGLKPGQRIAMKYLIRAAAVKSANDAATALAEAISGSEAAFARRMTVTARRMGMKNTTFKNAHGLTATGHLSTARDMTTLGRRLFYDFPQYYNLFSRRSTNAGMGTVLNTNRKFLGSYKGADGIKTGYTRASGSNLVASAERGNKRIITTMFGGTSSAARNKRVSELMDLGFSRAPNSARVAKLTPIQSAKAVAPKTIKVQKSGLVKTSIRPLSRPTRTPEPLLLSSLETPAASSLGDGSTVAATTSLKPAPRVVRASPEELILASVSAGETDAATAQPEAETARIITRVSTSGSRHWAIQLGAYNNRHLAEKKLLKTALRDLRSLQGAGRRIDYTTVDGSKKYRARFIGLTQADANKSCARLRAQNETCTPVAPS